MANVTEARLKPLPRGPRCVIQEENQDREEERGFALTTHTLAERCGEIVK